VFISIVDETSLILRCASVSFAAHCHVLVDHGNKTLSEYLLIHSFQYAVSVPQIEQFVCVFMMNCRPVG